MPAKRGAMLIQGKEKAHHADVQKRGLTEVSKDLGALDFFSSNGFREAPLYVRP